LSDGADEPRTLGEAACVGTTQHVLDWFHLSMQVQHVAQAAMGWPDALAEDRKTGASLGETAERILWRLWHGQVRRGLDLIAETVAMLETKAETPSPAASTALKVMRLLGELGTYVCGQSDIIIDYATATRRIVPSNTTTPSPKAAPAVPFAARHAPPRFETVSVGQCGRMSHRFSAMSIAAGLVAEPGM
jgi:hypothetical protein